MKQIFFFCTSLLLTMFCVAADVEGIDEKLQQFDKAQGGAAVNIANQLMRQFSKNELTEQLIQFASPAPLDSLRQQVWYWAGEHYYALAKYPQAITYAQKALPLFAQGTQADCLNLLALSCFRMSDYENAAKYAKECYRLDELTGDPDIMSSSLNTLAGIYIGANQPKEAEKYILKALELAKQANNPARQAVLHGMASEVYHAQGKDDKALEQIDIACDLEKSMGRNDKLNVRLTQKASVLLGLHRWKEAEQILAGVIPALQKLGDKHSLGIACNKMGMALLSQDRDREAVTYYRQAAAIFSEMGDLGNELHSHRGLYEALWTINPDSAKIELDRFDLLKDSLYSVATAESLAKFNAEFDNEWLQHENESLSGANRRNIIIGLSLMVLLLLAAWALISRLRRRHQQQMQALIREIDLLREVNQPVQTQVTMDEYQPVEPSEETDTPSDEDRSFLMQVIEAVYDGMPKGEFSVDTIASKVNMSVSTLRRRLLSAAGKSPKAYIQAIQMERAIQLLDEQDLTVAQIANLCGFSETSNFSHTFKRVYGCTPSQYRNK